MWTVIYIANHREQAEILKTILTEEGILVDIRPASVSQTDGMQEILVPESEANEAHAVICRQMMK